MKRKYKAILLIVLLLAGALLCGVMFVKYKYDRDVRKDFETIDVNAQEDPTVYKDRINVLFMGMEGPRTDMMMVGTFDPKAKKLDVISVPRDLYGDYDGARYNTERKLNAVYGFGKKKGGVKGLAKEISKILGIPIHQYIQVDYNGVRNIVDAIGGVEVNIPFNMYYDDATKGLPEPLHIHFSPGPTVLMGDRALEYLRWRKNSDGTRSEEGDLGRVRRQQEFMKKALEKALNPKKLPDVINAVFNNVETSFSLSQLLSLGKSATDMESSDINFYETVGMAVYFDHLWYFVAEDDKNHALMQKLTHNEPITKEDLEPSKEFVSEMLRKDRSNYKNTDSTVNKKREDIKEHDDDDNSVGVTHKIDENNNIIFNINENNLEEGTEKDKDTELENENNEINENKDKTQVTEDGKKDTTDQKTETTEKNNEKGTEVEHNDAVFDPVKPESPETPAKPEKPSVPSNNQPQEPTNHTEQPSEPQSSPILDM